MVGIIELALAYHGEAKPTLSSVARTTGRASRLLRISDLDERISVENAATLALAKKLNLVS